MKDSYKNYRKLQKIWRLDLFQFADYFGLVASCLCFIHCMALPLLLLFLPGFVPHNEMVHPFLCSAAILSTLPHIIKKKFRLQSVFLQFALGFGNIIMLLILLTHEHLAFTDEIILNTIGGCCLVYVHYHNLGNKKRCADC